MSSTDEKLKVILYACEFAYRQHCTYVYRDRISNYIPSMSAKRFLEELVKIIEVLRIHTSDS